MSSTLLHHDQFSFDGGPTLPGFEAVSSLRSSSSAFSRDYDHARRKFRHAVPDAREYSLPELLTPQGSPLAIDVGWFGDRSAECLLVVISGTHGPEGHCGSAIQLDWLNCLKPDDLPQGVAILFIHALNPYGFAWDRRVTQEGCDLNRNFIDFSAGVPSNPGFDELREYLVPITLEGPAFEVAQEAIQAFRLRNGETAFQVARKAGQYSDPLGMFFGGFEPAWSAQVLDKIAVDYKLTERNFLAVIDVHTGLGPYGYGELQSEHKATSASHLIAENMFGPTVTSADIGTSTSIPIEGTLQLYWERLLGDGNYLYLCLEYGTFDTAAAQRVLLADQWLHVHGGGDRTSARGLQIREQMRDHFCPADPIWQEAVLFRARQVLRQTLVGLTGKTTNPPGPY
ncbi:Imp dehydrogenase/gmp reductase; protein [Neorhizobium galegae bv. officinalis]|uniref:Imp dehydrogenase/gmp reductase protein n=1 Tax=Neorhizobium galegae bv. officinalis TaxID=323656 RepID=A0A0T7H544_NEOGA|nr:DUF2817 domain-containing protein [Neorhizobium galegae]CDZ40805.1 Imp dehydrogenase/gmp reductase; protein [Neorhizobium galegae bv. officinalis]CDZ54618.1 Imp dehydrogenase/gmp reductase; protein [Neorhizobium galegae bv. officinalis]